MKKIISYSKIIFIVISFIFIFSIAFSKDDTKAKPKTDTKSSNVKKDVKDKNKNKKTDTKDKSKDKKKDDSNKKKDNKKDNKKNEEEGLDDDSEIPEDEDMDTDLSLESSTISENDIKLESLYSNNDLTGLYSDNSNSLVFNTSIPYVNKTDTVQYDEYYNVSNAYFDIKKSSDVKIYKLDRMYCTGINDKTTSATQMIFIDNGNVYVSGIFKGVMQKIRILGIKVPQYNKTYKPTHFKEYYLEKDKSFDTLKINGYNIATKKTINDINIYKDYYNRRIVKHLDTILREHTVFLAFDSIERDENGILTAYFYLKNYDCLNKRLIEEGFAYLDTNISLNSKNRLFFLDEFIKSQDIARKEEIGIYYSKKEKIRK